jgi:hypothetical protein
MSAIDFFMDVGTTIGKAGEQRVVITFNGKFLPHTEQLAANNTTERTALPSPPTQSNSTSSDNVSVSPDLLQKLIDQQEHQQEAITTLTKLLESGARGESSATTRSPSTEKVDNSGLESSPVISDQEAAAIAGKLKSLLPSSGPPLPSARRDSPHHQFPHRCVSDFKAWLWDNENTLQEEEFVEAFQSCYSRKDRSQLTTAHQFNLTTKGIDTAYMWCFQQNPFFVSGSEPVERLEKIYNRGTKLISEYLTTHPESRIHLNPDITKNIRKERAADLLVGFGFDRKATRISADDWHVRFSKALMLCKLFQVLWDNNQRNRK